MAEATLALNYTEYKARVGFYLRLGRDSTKWTTPEGELVDMCVQDGLREFYHPTLIEAAVGNGGVPHRWSFLQETTTVTMTANQYTSTLPDEFGGMTSGKMIYAPGSSATTTGINKTTPARIETCRTQMNAPVAPPTLFAVRPILSTTLTTGQRWEIIWFPTPNMAHVARYTYEKLLNALTALLPIPLGGEYHGDTILAAMLARAEMEVGDKVRGPKYEQFQERMRASIALDSLTGPTKLGKMQGAGGSDDWNGDPIPTIYMDGGQIGL